MIKKRLLLLIILGAFLSAAPAIHAAITYSPVSPNVEQEVQFSFSPPLPFGTQVTWEFGDGVVLTSTAIIINHTYNTLAIFTVKATYENKGTKTEWTTVTTHERRRVDFTPSMPLSNQITLTAVNFIDTLVIWDFGDGTTIQGGIRPTAATIQTHAYAAPGIYKVRVRDKGGAGLIDIEANVTVSAIPTITHNPERPRIGKQVVFNANNFASTTLIRWDFGDGTILDDSTPPAVTHTYNRTGTFLVKAYDGGRAVVTATKTVVVATAAAITYTPTSPRTGQPVRFTALNFFSTAIIRWDFGDGTIQNDTSPPVIDHIYNQPGTYLVRAYDEGGVAITAAVSVQVTLPASISFLPGDPRQGEAVMFAANNFLSNSLIRWDFGEGTTENDTSPPSISHTYSNPGVYLVRAYDGGGAAVTASLPINILPPRIVTYSPQAPRLADTVTFTATNFSSPLILWDFGDGSPVQQGGLQVNHTYSRVGVFTVTATDTRDNAPFPVTFSIKITPVRGPTASFSISFINLRFEDGKAYKSVPKNFAPLKAFAEIKYEGSGILFAQWLVDGSPIRLVTQTLVNAEQTLIDSGELPGLPTLIPGIHEVTLRFIQPQIEFIIPVIRYFVIVENKFDTLRAGLDISGVKGLDGKAFSITGNFVLTPQGRHFLLTGNVRNESTQFIPFMLMRIYLEDKLTDQKVLRDTSAGEERPFETSVFNGGAEEKKITITLYDISDGSADLIFIRELILLTSK